MDNLIEIVGVWADQDCDQLEEMVEEEFSSVNLTLYELKGALNKRKDLYKSKDLKSLQQDMDEYASNIFQKTKKIRSLINAMKTREEVNPVVIFRLLEKEKQFLRSFKRVMNKADRECKDSVQRWCFILTGQKLGDDIVESIISTGNHEALVKFAVESGKETISMETLAREVADQQGEMELLRISLVDLGLLFQQMQSLVQTEGEHINDVERYLNSASSRVRTGSNRLNTARNYNKWNNYLRSVGLGMIGVAGFLFGRWLYRRTKRQELRD